MDEQKSERSSDERPSDTSLDENKSQEENLPEKPSENTETSGKNEETKPNLKTTDKTEISEKQDAYAEHVHYENELAIYTDPSTKYQYVWSNEKNEWIPREIQPHDSKDDKTKTNEGEYGYEGDSHTYTDADGVIYIWDTEKNAWFPKLDEEFMARYQLSYGLNSPQTSLDITNKISIENKETTNSDDKIKDPNSEESKKRKAQQEATWFDLPQEQNTKVYVTGLPDDITENEFVEIMSKCGLVERDAATQKMKIKIYLDSNGYPKGDALCTYIRVESVDLALNLLDGSDVRGHCIQVQRAKFEMKGEYNPSLKPKKKRKKDKEKQKKMKEKLFDWRPEKMRGERSKHERVVVIRNLFEPRLFDEQVELILEFQQDLRDECSKLGEVKRVVLYDRHPEGIAQITMGEPEQADAVVELMNGRWFNKRQLKSEIWDGKTKFKIGETDSEISERLKGWDKFLEGDVKVGDDKVVDKVIDGKIIDGKVVDGKVIDGKVIDDRVIDDKIIDKVVDDKVIDDKVIDDKVIDDKVESENNVDMVSSTATDV